MSLRQRFCRTSVKDQNFGMCITPQDLILPLYDFNTNYYRPWQFYNGNVKDFLSTIDNGNDIFKINLDVQHFNPNEISVKVNNDSAEVIIEAKHDEVQDSYGSISRQFTRRYILPNDCILDTVTSTLSSDGVLTIKANKKSVKVEEKNIPIKLEETCQVNQRYQYNKGIHKDLYEENNRSDNNEATNSSMIREEHSCLLKPELLRDIISERAEKSLKGAKSVHEELTSSDNTQAESSKIKLIDSLRSEILNFENVKSKNTEIFGQSSMKATSEMSSYESNVSKRENTSTSCESSSLISSRIGAKTEDTTKFVKDITMELKEAAENIEK